MTDNKYRYLCDRNHEIATDKPISKCPALVHGKACPGKLKSVGKGSRSKDK